MSEYISVKPQRVRLMWEVLWLKTNSKLSVVTSTPLRVKLKLTFPVTAFAESESESLKNQGNDAFGKGNYDKAIALYSQALNLLETRTDTNSHHLAILHGNRAECYFRKKLFKESLEDGSKCVSHDSSWFRVNTILFTTFAIVRTQPSRKCMSCSQLVSSYVHEKIMTRSCLGRNIRCFYIR